MMGEDRPKAALRRRPSGHRRQRALTAPCANQFMNHMRNALSLFEKGPSALEVFTFRAGLGK